MRKDIRALVMDVDGTLTDGGIYIGEKGEVMKKFHVKDGYGIKHLLPANSIIPIVITGRTSIIVENRCKELGIELVVQGCENKVVILKKIIEELQIDFEQVAYIGDDLNDFDAMQLVGIRGCPKNAVKEIKDNCDFVGLSLGGEGAVREFIDWLLGEDKECVDSWTRTQ